MTPRRRPALALVTALVTALVLTGCVQPRGPVEGAATSVVPGAADVGAGAAGERDGELDADADPVTIAVAGDVHFEGHLADLPGSGGDLGPISSVLGAADEAMVNLETAITERGTPSAKERERPGNRFYFRAPPEALDVLADSGVDVVSVANNHGADYGLRGLRDTLRLARSAPIGVIGAGRETSPTTIGGRVQREP